MKFQLHRYLIVLALLVFAAGAAFASDFYGIATNANAWQDNYVGPGALSYNGTITNINDINDTVSEFGHANLYVVIGNVPSNPPVSPMVDFLSSDIIAAPLFFQVYNPGADSVTSSTAYWDNTLKQFKMFVTGANLVDGSIDNSGNTASLNLPNQLPGSWAGTWQSYSFDFTANFPLAAVPDSSFYNNGLATDVGNSDPNTVIGNFSGMFYNATVNKTYTVSFSFNYDIINPDNQFAFGTGTIVPEPSSLVLLTIGLLGISTAALSRRK
jgi:hypothetical protein